MSADDGMGAEGVEGLREALSAAEHEADLWRATAEAHAMVLIEDAEADVPREALVEERDAAVRRAGRLTVAALAVLEDPSDEMALDALRVARIKDAPEPLPEQTEDEVLLRHAATTRRALEALVRLKDGPRDENYRAAKPAAWDYARAALAKQAGDRHSDGELRALREEFSEGLSDPREAGGTTLDPSGDPHGQDTVLYDMRRAILLEGFEFSVAHPTSRGERMPDAVAMVVWGRVNRPPDHAPSAEMPAEHVKHLHMTDWEGAAKIVAEVQALAGRAGFDLRPLLEKRWAELRAEGLTERR